MPRLPISELLWEGRGNSCPELCHGRLQSRQALLIPDRVHRPGKGMGQACEDTDLRLKNPEDLEDEVVRSSGTEFLAAELSGHRDPRQLLRRLETQPVN